MGRVIKLDAISLEAIRRMDEAMSQTLKAGDEIYSRAECERMVREAARKAIRAYAHRSGVFSAQEEIAHIVCEVMGDGE